MSILARGRVVGGHLRVDIPVDLPDNTEVELRVTRVTSTTELDEELDPELEAALDEADAAYARGERGRPLGEAIERLRSRSRDEALSDTPARQG